MRTSVVSVAQTTLFLQRTSFENDWKLISIFIGGNDLCALGRDPDGASPETYRDEIKAALDIMHDQVGQNVAVVAWTYDAENNDPKLKC